MKLLLTPFLAIFACFAQASNSSLAKDSLVNSQRELKIKAIQTAINKANENFVNAEEMEDNQYQFLVTIRDGYCIEKSIYQVQENSISISKNLIVTFVEMIEMECM